MCPVVIGCVTEAFVFYDLEHSNLCHFLNVTKIIRSHILEKLLFVSVLLCSTLQRHYFGDTRWQRQDRGYSDTRDLWMCEVVYVDTCTQERVKILYFNDTVCGAFQSSIDHHNIHSQRCVPHRKSSPKLT